MACRSFTRGSTCIRWRKGASPSSLLHPLRPRSLPQARPANPCSCLCVVEQLLAEAGNSAYILSRALVDAEFAIAEGGGGHGPAEQRAGKTHVWVQAAEERAQIAQQHASAKGSRTARADNHAAESADRARDVDVRAEEAVVQASHADARALHAEEPASKEE